MANLDQITDPLYNSQKGQANGAATLGADGKLPSSQAPIYNSGDGIGITGTYPNFTVTNTGIITSTGTWTPALTGIANYTVQNNSYARNGNIIHVTFSFQLTTSSSVTEAGQVLVTGFPMFGKNTIGVVSTIVWESPGIYAKDGVFTTVDYVLSPISSTEYWVLTNNLSTRTALNRSDIIPVSNVSTLGASLIYILA